MRLVALIGGVTICTEWGYKAFEAISHRWEKKANRRVSSASEGLLNGVLEKGE
jgi:hypothetical protein